jgi:hypothetical protein
MGFQKKKIIRGRYSIFDFLESHRFLIQFDLITNQESELNQRKSKTFQSGF